MKKILVCLGILGSLSAADLPPYIVTGMVKQEVVDQLPPFKEMPRDLYKLKFDLKDEDVYELVGAQDGLGWSFAVADIIQSVPHSHQYTTEIYTVVNGEGELRIDDKKYIIRTGDVVVIPLKSVHSVKSLNKHPVRILVSAIPAWEEKDYKSEK